MELSTYIAISSQSALTRRLDVIANNIANSSTPGFKKEGMIFNDFVKDAGRGNQAAYVSDVATYADFTQGSLKHTARPLDVSINGEGFFELSTPLGPRYSRLGAFQINQEGILTTAEGYVVQGEGDAIVFSQGDTDIKIGADGTIKATVNGISEERGKLRVVKFENPQKIEKTGDGMFISAGEEPQIAEVSTDYQIAQGLLEGSNVNSTIELTELIRISRAVESSAKAIEAMDEAQRRSISILTKQ